MAGSGYCTCHSYCVGPRKTVRYTSGLDQRPLDSSYLPRSFAVWKMARYVRENSLWREKNCNPLLVCAVRVAEGLGSPTAVVVVVVEDEGSPRLVGSKEPVFCCNWIRPCNLRVVQIALTATFEALS